MRRLNRVLDARSTATSRRRSRRARRCATSTMRCRGTASGCRSIRRSPTRRPSAASLATNDSGPLRHRYGAPRDLVIGVQLATTDGALVEGGRQGRQERRRLRSRQAGRRIVRQPGGDRQRDVQARRRCRRRRRRCRRGAGRSPSLAQAVRTVMAEPARADGVRGPRCRGSADQARERGRPSRPRRCAAALLRFASMPAAVDAQVAGSAPTRCSGGAHRWRGRDGDAERDAVARARARLWDGAGAIVRASWLPAALAAVAWASCALRSASSWSAAPRSARARAHRRRRQRAGARDRAAPRTRRTFGNVVVLRGSAALKALVDVWGPQGDRGRLLRVDEARVRSERHAERGPGPL